MAGDSRSKNGVASARLYSAIHVFLAWIETMPGSADQFSSLRRQTALAGHDDISENAAGKKRDSA
jgi:hypothetical protein